MDVMHDSTTYHIEVGHRRLAPARPPVHGGEDVVVRVQFWVLQLNLTPAFSRLPHLGMVSDEVQVPLLELQLLPPDSATVASITRAMEQLPVPAEVRMHMLARLRLESVRVWDATNSGGQLVFSVEVWNPDHEEDMDSVLDDLAFQDGASMPVRPTHVKELERFVVVDKNEDDDRCPVCLEDLDCGNQAARMPCGHVFHHGCILEWLAVRRSCPLCRFELPSR